jgi:HD-like signal output (HDOD) protein/ActR/RegA family two-component response regulator
MMRLLFVDDEPRILQALKQSLRTKRREWEMLFAEGGAAALEELGRAPFDAVITDMRMPGIDGAELLRRVKGLQPQALRVVLSGHVDDSTAVRAAGIAHRFLAKPCDSDVLMANLHEALALRTRLGSEEMKKCIAGIAGVPSLPGACLKLSKALEDEDVALDEVTRIIEADVGMAGKVLQLVNSSFFGLSRRIAGIGQAVRSLGLHTIRSLVMAQVLYEEFQGADVETMRIEQEHALLAARYARAFPLEARRTELAVTAALLHNVGQLALMARLPEDYRANHEYAAAHGVSLVDAERTRLGVTHADVGAYLLDLWGLPHEVTEAVGAHHDPIDAREALDPTAVVYLVDILAAEQAPSGQHAPMPAAETLERLGVTETITSLRRSVGHGERTTP